MDLCGVEIIPYENGIWFIDRKNKYWYFELRKSGLLYWRYSFFVDYFSFFCMDSKEFEPLIGQWVENVLNRKVLLTQTTRWRIKQKVEDVLNCKVSSTSYIIGTNGTRVEEVLNSKIEI